VVSAQALVSFRGNRYSVAPELANATATVSRRLGAGHLDIATPAGTVLARHTPAPDGAGVMVRDHGHVHALEHAAMAAASSATPHRRKQRIPPGTAALAAAESLRTNADDDGAAAAVTPSVAGEVVIDLARYAAAAQGRNTLNTQPPPTDPGTVISRSKERGNTMAATQNPTETGRSAPATAAHASRHQQLRGHLTTLKLHDAAEHLPAVLDAATAEGPHPHHHPGTTLLHRSLRHRSPPPRRPVATAPPSKAAGPPPCASSPDPASW
jgi:hypothetical protein